MELFDRHPRGLTLTTAGESFLFDVRKLMTDLEAAARKAKRISTGWAGRLRLGFVENSSWDGIVPEALRNFQVATPSASLDVAERPFITFPRWVYPVYYDQLMATCFELGVSLNVAQEEQTESAILALVGAGIGAALVNSANLGRPPASVRFLKLADLSLPMPLVFVYRSDNESPLLLRFVEALMTAREQIS